MSTHETPIAGQQPSVKAEAKSTASELADKAKTAASDAAHKVAETAKTQADAAKASAADEMSSVASALRTAAEEMRSGSPQERTLGQIAEGIADASDAMREKDLSTMVQDVSSFARRNPLIFLGGAALVGFAATRFAKASRPQTTQRAQTTAAPLPKYSTYGDLS